MLSSTKISTSARKHTAPQQARREATAYGYYGPMYGPALHAVAPEGAGGKVPPSWGESANSFLQGSPLPSQQLQLPVGATLGAGGQASSSLPQWGKPKRQWAALSQHEVRQDHNPADTHILLLTWPRHPVPNCAFWKACPGFSPVQACS